MRKRCRQPALRSRRPRRRRPHRTLWTQRLPHRRLPLLLLPLLLSQNQRNQHRVPALPSRRRHPVLTPIYPNPAPQFPSRVRVRATTRSLPLRECRVPAAPVESKRRRVRAGDGWATIRSLPPQACARGFPVRGRAAVRVPSRETAWVRPAVTPVPQDVVDVAAVVLAPVLRLWQPAALAALPHLAVRLRRLAVAAGAALPRVLSVTANPGKARAAGLSVRKSRSKMRP